jgi:hypothetical protein
MAGLLTRRRIGLLVTVAACGVALGFARSANAYWDYQGYLYNPCCPIEYLEGHSNEGTFWIRVTRTNCAAKIQLWNQYTGWEQEVYGCEYSDIRTSFGTSYYTSSRALNGTSGTSVYVNVRIAATL